MRGWPEWVERGGRRDDRGAEICRQTDAASVARLSRWLLQNIPRPLYDASSSSSDPILPRSVGRSFSLLLASDHFTSSSAEKLITFVKSD